MASVQLYGIDQVLQAAENFGQPCWAIFEKTQFLSKWAGDGMEDSMQALQQYLEMIEHSKATYTIRFYECDSPKGLKIKSTTPYDGSINFVLGTPDGHAADVDRWAVMGSSRKINERLDNIEKMLLSKDDNEDPDEETIGSIVIDYLKTPDKLIPILGAIKDLFTTGSNYQRPAMLASVGGVPGEPMRSTMTEEEKYDRIGAAIDKLEKKDPKIVEHLEKLAAMASVDSPMFDMAIKVIDGLR